MADTPRTMGCANTLTHEAHEWTPSGKWVRVKGKRWCPGRVRCNQCLRTVFTTTATAVAGGAWVCAPRCR